MANIFTSGALVFGRNGNHSKGHQRPSATSRTELLLELLRMEPGVKSRGGHVNRSCDDPVEQEAEPVMVPIQIGTMVIVKRWSPEQGMPTCPENEGRFRR